MNKSVWFKINSSCLKLILIKNVTLFTEVFELSGSYICYCMPEVVRIQAHRSNPPAKSPEMYYK